MAEPRRGARCSNYDTEVCLFYSRRRKSTCSEPGADHDLSAIPEQAILGLRQRNEAFGNEDRLGIVVERYAAISIRAGLSSGQKLGRVFV
jgi:hypothetical protein